MARPVFARVLVSVVAFLSFAGATSWSLLMAWNPPVMPRQPRPVGYWFKGNLHTHSLRSDGDSTPGQVAAWYRDHGYDFLALTDHNVLSPTDTLNAKYGADHQFLLLPGEEVTDSFEDRPIHLNALGVSVSVEPQHGANAVDVMQRNVDAIRRAGGVPLLDHPNYLSPIGAETLRQVERAPLLELFNGNPTANTFGSRGVPGVEALWDRILSSGKLMYGVADDDAHSLRSDSGAAGPGRGWVFVHAERLAAQPILEALERGDFYASTGVELGDYRVTATGLTVEIRDDPSRTYRVQFIGLNGRVLEETSSTCASYTFRDGDSYVRVRIRDSSGAFAWTQPVFDQEPSPN